MFEAAGYRDRGAALNMSCPTTFRSPPPDGVTIARAIVDADAEAALALAQAHWPNWVAEVTRAVDHGTCFLARSAGDGGDGGPAIGFACHSVNRVGWVGPMATASNRRHAGVGGALLSALCADLRAASLPDAEIAWVGPVGFYAKTAGASVSRVFRVANKQLG